MKLSKTYIPANYEALIYELWLKQGSFRPSAAKAKYSLVLPPPNANGNLHLGHALTIAIEDTLARYHRLKGDSTLFIPGADHAGFETQVVFERQLEKQGKSRFDYDRDELFKQIWDFVEQNKGNMLAQLKALGASLDWDRFTFTLDPKVVKTTYQTFKRMWEEGLIYRGERLVNYCTHHRTSFADIEVVYEDRKTPLYYIKYGPFTLATTRPETKFGDTAIAVHPDDKRYQKYIGKVIQAEGINGPFEIRVVADKMVDPNFGTGAVKITPAHDFNDWEVAQRHNLPAIRVINHDGTLNERAGRFAGMSVAAARKAVVKALKDKGLLVKTDNHYLNRIGVCYKCGTAIEPMLMDQWFVRVEPLVKPAIKLLRANKITFYPASKKRVLINYLKNLKDWNISRQIAWGIPIPAFQNIDDPDDWIFDTRVNQDLLEKGGKKYRRDPDVFDTWFSSGQWPYVTLGYPEGKDYRDYYPLSLMETGHDILFQWVARMIMLGVYVTGREPFTRVYLHGLVLDKHGQKMSKSKGNVINPMEIVERYGADALRVGLLQGRSPGQNQAFTEDKVVGARNFNNKLWNIARFAENVLGEEFSGADARPKSAADHWILRRLGITVERVGSLLDAYRLPEAFEQVYAFIWKSLADWYVEASKVELNRGVLAEVLRQSLILAHSFAPFVTETIWQTLPYVQGELVGARWPSPIKYRPSKAADFDKIRRVINEIRELRGQLQLRENTLYHTGSEYLEENAELIVKLTGIYKIDTVKSGFGLRLINVEDEAWIDVERAAIADYVDSLTAKSHVLTKEIKQLRQRLANEGYLKKAPKDLIAESRRQLKAKQAGLLKIKAQIKNARKTLGK